MSTNYHSLNFFLAISLLFSAVACKALNKPTADAQIIETKLVLTSNTPVATLTPTITNTPEPTPTETKVGELENTICSECLLPRAIQKDYEGEYEGITIKFSFAMDKSFLKEPVGYIVDFYLNTANYPELTNFIAMFILRNHYYGWKCDNQGSSITFDKYINLVKNGGGQYTTIASIDNSEIKVKSQRMKWEYVTIDPKKRFVLILSSEPNPLAVNQVASVWPVQRIDGSIEMRRTGLHLQNKRPYTDFPEHYLGRLWIGYLIQFSFQQFTASDDMEIIKQHFSSAQGMPQEYQDEYNKTFLDEYIYTDIGKPPLWPLFEVEFR